MNEFCTGGLILPSAEHLLIYSTQGQSVYSGRLTSMYPRTDESQKKSKSRSSEKEGGRGGGGGHFENACELLNLRALKSSPVNKIYIF